MRGSRRVRVIERGQLLEVSVVDGRRTPGAKASSDSGAVDSTEAAVAARVHELPMATLLGRPLGERADSGERAVKKLAGGEVERLVKLQFSMEATMSIERRAVAKAAAGVLEDGAAARGMIGVLEAQGELARGSWKTWLSRLGIAPRSEPGPFASFGEQMQAVYRAGIYPGRVDGRLAEVQRRASPAGASEQVPADGGFLVAPEFAERLLERVYSTGQFLQRTTSVPISKPGSTGAKIAGFDEQSRENGLRFGGVLSYWQNEADEVLATKPKFREVESSASRS